MRAILIGILTVLLLGGIAGTAYQAGLAQGAAGAAGTAVAAYPWVHPFFFGFGFLGFLFPLFFLFLIFGLMRAAFWGGRWGHGYGGHEGRSRMLDEWHRQAHERTAGTGDHTGA